MKTALAKPFGVSLRLSARFLEGGSRCILLPSVGSIGFFSGITNPPPVHKSGFLRVSIATGFEVSAVLARIKCVIRFPPVSRDSAHGVLDHVRSFAPFGEFDADIEEAQRIDE